MRKLKIDNYADYTAYVKSEAGKGERSIMISSLTTNVSNFFREPHHFKTLRDEAFPALIKRAQSGGKVRIWSAGCSTGQEPYSIAMTLLDMEPNAGQLDIKILASDIDPNVIATARTAYYDIREITDIDEHYQNEYIKRVKTGIREGFEIVEKIRDLISFRELNLLRTWPISGVMDVIFCRNVVIYFDEETQLALWPKFESVIKMILWRLTLIFVGITGLLLAMSAATFFISESTQLAMFVTAGALLIVYFFRIKKDDAFQSAVTFYFPFVLFSLILFLIVCVTLVAAILRKGYNIKN